MWRVRWAKVARNALTEGWLQADSSLRQAITAATYQLDQHLQMNPDMVGESRPGGRRILLESPLGVLYRIEPGIQTVSVLRTWIFHKRSP